MKIVNPAVNAERLAPRPRVPHHCRLTDVDHLLVDVELAQPVVPLFLAGEPIKLGLVLPSDVLNVA